jgi:hypothetical protein
VGEANRRKASEPTYGKPKRGLVLSVPIEINDGHVFIRSGVPDPQELRTSLLYWDQLAWPTNNAIHIPGGPDIEFLETVKVLTRSPHNFHNFSGNPADIVMQSFTQAFEDLDKNSPDLWALSQGENSLLVKSGNTTKEEGIAIELYRAIPVPDRDVPLNEILEFRHKRYDELTLLRAEIDQLIVSINSSQDPKAELENSLRRIDEQCAAVLRVGSEWQFPVRLSNLKTTLDLKPFSVLRDGLTTFLISSALGATTAVVAGLTGVAAASSLKIVGDFGWKGLRSRTNPYRYVASFHKELF